jgi:hypothetical protein
MNKVIEKLLLGQEENHVLPFFWQHGEDEGTLRKYVNVIYNANCKAFCVESRPHPDFCGERWWKDMDAILDEAKKLGMKVWILDDAHFPTGYANGAVKNAPAGLCRQSICASSDGTFPPKIISNTERLFTDDRVISTVKFGETTWTVGLTRNAGYRRDYINVLSTASVRLLIDTVYEAHYTRYRHLFGSTIAGFFSDEPEFGNHYRFDTNVRLGQDTDYPFSEEVGEELERTLGSNWTDKMYLLFENNANKEETAFVRQAYMDAVTKTVRRTFSYQIGDWCRAHGVMYIGHIIEDNGAHARTCCSLGHYFRALEGQDMAGIDDIGGQVYPQGENCYDGYRPNRKRNADFFHFMLARLASSAAAIEKNKQGRALCEIFGDYGWTEGVQLEKYLADHFLVRGINYFVPHAFSPRAFPDPDCPPHFYAHGHNPQYRHFARLMQYMNRMATILSSGTRVARVGLLYHAEAEWRGDDFLPNELMARKLEEKQISFDIIPRDYFTEPEKFNDRHYQRVIECFEKEIPEGVSPEVVLNPASKFIRVCHISGEEEIYYFVNEAAETYTGNITLPKTKGCYVYDAWDNRIELIDTVMDEGRVTVSVNLEPRKSLILVFGETPAAAVPPLDIRGMRERELTIWWRSVCESIEYPHFTKEKQVALPDNLGEEEKAFSGYVRYETEVALEKLNKAVLQIDDAAEGVEVFVNGISAGSQIVPLYKFDLTFYLKEGVNQIVIEVATTLERKCYYLLKDSFAEYAKMTMKEPQSKSGISGKVRLFTK